MKIEEIMFNLKNKLPENKEGLKFIKKAIIGIPYAKTSLFVTIRKESEISFFHEITMKLIENDWNNYDELRKLMGLKAEYMDNILIELGRNDYINHYGQKITLTEKGETELKNQKSIKIESDIINTLYVNLIDGTLLFAPQNIRLTKSIKSKITLNEIINISLDYLINIEDKIRDLYKEYQREIKENQRITDIMKKSHDFSSNDELYRIVNIEAVDIFYHEEKIDIYFDDENNSFVYVFSTGDSTKDELYSNSFKEQLATNQNSLDYMFDTKYYYNNRLNTKRLEIPFDKISTFYHNRDSLVEILNQISKRNCTDLSEKFYEKYYSNRVMLYKEYKNFIFELTEINIDEIFIISNRFYDLTGDSYILSIIGSLIKKCRIHIGYINHPGNNFIKKAKKNFDTSKNIVFKEFEEINHTSIYVPKNYIIDIYYNPIRVGANIILEEIPIILFDKKIIKKRIEEIRLKF